MQAYIDNTRSKSQGDYDAVAFNRIFAESDQMWSIRPTE